MKLTLKIWVDNVRLAPDGYFHCRSVNEVISTIELAEFLETLRPDRKIIELINLDHDAGKFACDGGDYINILNWLEETGRNYPIHIHSMNPVGVENIKRIIEHNGWKEV